MSVDRAERAKDGVDIARSIVDAIVPAADRPGVYFDYTVADDGTVRMWYSARSDGDETYVGVFAADVPFVLHALASRIARDR